MNSIKSLTQTSNYDQNPLWDEEESKLMMKRKAIHKYDIMGASAKATCQPIRGRQTFCRAVAEAEILVNMRACVRA
jgi:hypothetical protein